MSENPNVHDDIEEEGLSSSDIQKYFANEEKQIHGLMEEIDELYIETKSFFDKVMHSKTKGSLTFIKDQTSNLITLKTSKLALIKELTNIKKTSLELDHKFNKDDDAGGYSKKDAELIKQMIKEMDSSGNLSNEEYGDDDSEDFENNEIIASSYEDDEDEEFERAFEERGIELNDSERAMKFEKRKVRIVVYIESPKKLDEWEFLAIDPDYNVIDDYPLPDRKFFNMVIDRDKTGDYFAKDQNDRSFEVVLGD